jgi:hypothetical protein
MSRLCDVCDLPADLDLGQLRWCRFIKMTLADTDWDSIKPNLAEKCKLCVASGDCGECTLQMCVPPRERQ